jgi:flagellar biosynthesis protein FlhA
VVADSDHATANHHFLNEYIPTKVTPEMLLSVLRLLLEERVSIRNLFLIIETIAEVKASSPGLPRTVELVRQRLSFQIVDRLQDDQGRLPLVQLSTSWEQKFTQYEISNDNGSCDVALPPEMFGELTAEVQSKLNEAARKGVIASVATSSRRRRFLQTVLASKGIRNSVLAYEEITAKTKPYIIGVV